ncbi:MAG: hypothetical protein LBC33_02630 [Mycoplasmataceae bacterium]|jgi:hypothetical protein|nr:hypothetical protein [Mycoplasmataceae bacterium]
MAYHTIIFDPKIINTIVTEIISMTPGVDKSKEVWIDIDAENCVINIIYSSLSETVNVVDISRKIQSAVYERLSRLLNIYHNLLKVNIKCVYSSNSN